MGAWTSGGGLMKERIWFCEKQKQETKRKPGKRESVEYTPKAI
jgi:hypothetical protein